MRFLYLSTTFGYAQLWWATVIHSQSGYGPNAIKRLNGSKKRQFLATSQNFNGSSLLQITKILQLDYIELDFNAIFIEKHCFYSIFLFNQNYRFSV